MEPNTSIRPVSRELEEKLAQVPGLLSMPPIAETEVGKAIAGLSDQNLKAYFKAKQKLAKQFKLDPQVAICKAILDAVKPKTADALAALGAPNPIDVLSILDHFSALAERGIERVYTWFCDFAPPDTLHAFGDEVLGNS